MYKNISTVKAAHVTDVAHYNNEMRKALIDKIFYLDKVGDTDVYVDYGCADGAVLQLAATLNPAAQYYGYDMAPEMIAAAAKNNVHSNVRYTGNLYELKKFIQKQKSLGKKICVSLLSLIHEVYAYGPEKVKTFWENTLESDFFDYVAIRDMCVSRTTSRPADPISVAKIRTRYDKNMLAQWEAQWGCLEENWSLVHFLLTYRYVDSWDRELRENYLPLPLESLLNLIPECYEPIYLEHYTLPYIRQQIRADFGVDCQDRTHLKLILKRK